ncbi:MAG: histidinol-phosphate transaminase [Cellvibrionaceae bacterium]
MSKFWSKIVHDLTPYVPGEQPRVTNLVKLNTNECPYPPSPVVLDRIKEATNDDLRLYPDPDASQLKAAIAKHFSGQTSSTLSSNNVFIGNGSDEILAHTFQALFKHDQPLLFPDISYSFYPVYCNLYQIDSKKIPLDSDFSINIDDYSIPNGGIIIPNPNAPTGCALSLGDIETLLQRNPDAVVAIDEAYVDFGANTAVSLINQYPNLLVIQTLSKSRSLAGLRVGFAIGNESLIEALIRVKDSFNSYPLDKLAIAGATASIEDKQYFDDTCKKVIATRQYLTEQLNTLNFSVLPSMANFVFCSHDSITADVLAAELRTHNIIVRHFTQARIDNFLRISIGTDLETKTLLNALKTIISARS